VSGAVQALAGDLLFPCTHAAKQSGALQPIRQEIGAVFRG
jgi:hypothetical protein